MQPEMQPTAHVRSDGWTAEEISVLQELGASVGRPSVEPGQYMSWKRAAAELNRRVNLKRARPRSWQAARQMYLRVSGRSR